MAGRAGAYQAHRGLPSKARYPVRAAAARTGDVGWYHDDRRPWHVLLSRLKERAPSFSTTRIVDRLPCRRHTLSTAHRRPQPLKRVRSPV